MSKLYYSEEHMRCGNYQSEGRNLFSQCQLRYNEEYELLAPNEYSFIFVLRGSLHLSGNGVVEIVKENNIYSLGYDIALTLRSLGDSSFLVLCFDTPNILCNKLEISELEQHLSATVPEVPSLRMNEPIWLLVHSVLFYLDNEMLCRRLHGLKLEEWFFLIRHHYTKKQNADFFYPLIQQNDSFEAMVRRKAKKVATVNELAYACHMTPKTLTRKFKKVFDTTPKQWLLMQKRDQVMLEFLHTQNKKELPNKLGFSSYSHLNYYCIRQFGKSIKDL